MPPDDHDKPLPGAVPAFVSPHQVTAPLPLAHGPWIYPPHAPPPEHPKKDSGGLDLAIKLIGVAVLIGTIIFSAGALSEKLKHIEENQKAADGQLARRAQQDSERDEKFKAALQAFGEKVESLAEQVKEQARAPRRGRRREADQVLPLGP